MSKRFAAVLAAAALIPALAWVAPKPGSAKEMKKGGETRMFKVVNLEYKGTKVWVPGTLIVRRGEKVKVMLVNDAPSGVHGFSIDAFGVKEGVAKGEPKTVEFTADKAGLFDIYCHLHPAHIGGQLLVLE